MSAAVMNLPTIIPDGATVIAAAQQAEASHLHLVIDRDGQTKLTPVIRPGMQKISLLIGGRNGQSIVIVHGPQGSGKTRLGQQLMKRYGCTRMVDDWDGKTPLKEGDLALTNMTPPFAVSGAILVKWHGHRQEGKSA